MDRARIVDAFVGFRCLLVRHLDPRKGLSWRVAERRRQTKHTSGGPVVALPLDGPRLAGTPDAVETVAPTKSGGADDDRYLTANSPPRCADAIALIPAHDARHGRPIGRDDDD